MPVPFPLAIYSSLTFQCKEGGFWFFHNKELVSFTVRCIENNTYEEPEVWPYCVPCKL